ncbi:DUF4232 domain-containing protein [Saccharothrix coeruleofusca]|uniref:DUF4232 domain-containing protein n=1 Tax=Saccharothrix coeruleofusca TaxID=33919 RepID=UPI0016709260|nr:DUF4232 domain-containing protein [Saccharothrix coeruleofusca]MBP2335129.1 hypothetical protein [Saccharothrix coeruleofusca]
MDTRSWGLVLVLALTACGATPTPQPPPPAPTTTEQPPPQEGCPDSGVRINAGDSDAAMGLRVMALEMTNCGEETITVQGYPGVVVLDGEQQPLNVAVLQGAQSITSDSRYDQPTTVVLEPGATARSGIAWRNTYTDVTAPPLVGEHLRVAPWSGAEEQLISRAPASTSSGAAPINIDLGSTGKVGVYPWRLGDRRVPPGEDVDQPPPTEDL